MLLLVVILVVFLFMKLMVVNGSIRIVIVKIGGIILEVLSFSGMKEFCFCVVWFVVCWCFGYWISMWC